MENQINGKENGKENGKLNGNCYICIGLYKGYMSYMYGRYNGTMGVALKDAR